MKIYNTLSREKENFKPLKEGAVSFYYCGPTVYKPQHIGGLRGNATADFIRRSFEYLGYKTNLVSNYTDVGHLTSDEDSGEDKLSKQASIEKKTPKEIADKIIDLYEKDTNNLNIIKPTTRCRATDYIQEMIDMVQILIDKGFAYQTELAIYFDVSKAKNYTQLSGQNIEENIKGAGTGEVLDPEKKNPVDFVLWFFKKGVHKNALQTWSSPWGEGFPGWHIECSAMAKKHLGDTIDVHMGGIEHIPTHHTNEIAQSESANGVKFVNYWIHNEHLGAGNTKMSKSLGNVVLVEDIIKKGIDPLALRYFFLQAHYRSKQNFTWEALVSSQKGLANLYEQVAELQKSKKPFWMFWTKGRVNEEFKKRFVEKISDDFNTPQALAIVFDLLKSNLSEEDKLSTILDFDKILGLNLKDAENKIGKKLETKNLSSEVKKLLEERKLVREDKNYQKSDSIREELQKLGYEVKDTSEGQEIYKK